jgi:D-lyxose ketol-isomerase
MKRSKINRAIRWAKDLLDREGWRLPVYAYWDIDTWKKNAEKTENIRKLMLGWDVTDYGLDDYKNIGGVLYTLRNGSLNEKSCGVPYAEKLIILEEGQALPLHFHFTKTEDIINRRGGRLWLQLYNSQADNNVDYQNDVTVSIDGIWHIVHAGEKIVLENGQSISLTPRLYHKFGAVAGTGELIVGEVSSINDDNIDNHFFPDMPRYIEVEEDEPCEQILCNEYDRLLD